MLALTMASEQGHLDVVRALLAEGADVNAKNAALLTASARGRLDIVQALLAEGGRPQCREEMGRDRAGCGDGTRTR